MAEGSSFHYNFRLDGYASRATPSAKITKRHRVPLSCAPCRTRKLKCDRAQPCGQCSLREEVNSCSYATGASRHTTLRVGADSDKKTQHTKDQLHCLEKLVAEAVKLHQVQTQSPISVDSALNLSSGASSDGLSTEIPSAEGDQLATEGPTNWTIILGNIQDVIADLGVNADTGPNADDNHDSTTTDDPDNISIFTIGRPPSLESVLSELPPRAEVDRYLSRYFNVEYVVLPIIHVSSFKRMYEAFWKDPLQVPIFWIAQLFAILSISALLSDLRGFGPYMHDNHLSAKRQFLKAAAQCLNLGNFTQPRKYVVEALLLYTQCKYMWNQEPVTELWVLFGLIVRQALRMGYHRDPDHLQNITVFEGEMRRRCWAVLRQLDILNSYQVGLPSSTQSLHSDTALPRNLQDSDFDETSLTLPVARPEIEASHMLYFLVKAGLVTAFEEILKQESSLKALPDQNIAALDANLRQLHDSIPLPFKLRSITESFADTPHVIITRANLEILFQKSICILHRRSLTVELPSMQTIDICADASMRMLEVQVGLHEEAKPGGQLHEERWMLSSLTTTDFFLAAMILSLVLLKEPAQGLDQDSRRSKRLKLDLLDKSFFIFDAQETTSNQACKISLALRTVKSKLKKSLEYEISPNTPSDQTDSVEIPSFMAAPQLHQDAAPTDRQTADTPHDPENISDYFDWDLFDQYPFDLDTNATHNFAQTANCSHLDGVP